MWCAPSHTPPGPVWSPSPLGVPSASTGPGSPHAPHGGETDSFVTTRRRTSHSLLAQASFGGARLVVFGAFSIMTCAFPKSVPTPARDEEAFPDAVEGSEVSWDAVRYASPQGGVYDARTPEGELSWWVRLARPLDALRRLTHIEPKERYAAILDVAHDRHASIPRQLLSADHKMAARWLMRFTEGSRCSAAFNVQRHVRVHYGMPCMVHTPPPGIWL